MLYKLIRPASIVSMVLDLYCWCMYFCNVGICEIITLRCLWWCVLPKSGRWGNDALFHWRSKSFNVYRCSHPNKVILYIWKLFKQWRTIATYLQFDVSLQPRRVYARRTKGYGHTYTTRWININGNRNYLDKNYLNQTMQLPEYRKVSSSISITFSKRNERRLWEVVRWEFTRESKRDLSSDISFGYKSRKKISLVTTHNNLQSKIGIPYPYIE